MVKWFFKKKECSCIVQAFVCEIQHINNIKVYLIGGHTHYYICDTCKELEEMKNEDTLYDMWYNDNVTDDFGHGEWKSDVNNL